MARDGRGLKIAQEMQRLLADILHVQVKDPRINALVTITAVDLSPDRTNAKVLVTLMGSDEACKSTLTGLNRSAAFIRGALAKRMRLRRVPALSFVFDASVDRGARVTRLIESAMRESGTDGTDGDAKIVPQR